MRPEDKAETDSVHVDRLDVWVRGGQRRRDPHRHADAAVTGRVRRYRRVAVDRVAAGEVHRVEQRAERARVEAVHLAVDGETPDRREAAGEAGGGDGNARCDTTASDDVQDLERLV